MGTETSMKMDMQMMSTMMIVKLNNPLMGTETYVKITPRIFFTVFNIVKLNNPLMGTETKIANN